MKQYVGFSNDHSGSMRSHQRNAANDFNANLAAVQNGAREQNIQTLISVVECGFGTTDRVRRTVLHEQADRVRQISFSDYTTQGRGTPLWDSVGDLIEAFEQVPDRNDIEVSFLVMVTTDGAENASRKYSAASIAKKIQELQDTDRWTFVFRVPRGHKAAIVAKGIPEGNVMEWDTNSSSGMVQAQQATTSGLTSYYTARASGQTATRKFFTDLSAVTSKDVAAVLEDISQEVAIFPVSTADHDVEIRPFIEARLHGKPMLKGAGFYQLTKTEPTVQPNKKILVRDKTTQAIYYGDAARQMLGLPTYGNIRLAPGNHGNFDIFIQSTSVNRKLTRGTSLVYWENVGVRYKEGPSAR